MSFDQPVYALGMFYFKQRALNGWRDLKRGCFSHAVHNAWRFTCTRRWLYLDPVEKWTMLVDLGRRAPLLLEAASLKSVPLSPSGCVEIRRARAFIRFCGDPMRGRQAPVSVPHVHFSESCSQKRDRLVNELPYCVRLQLCLSLLMWVQTLRNVQDTFAHLRMPFAVTRRWKRGVIADVFPTRLAEACVDPFTTVSLIMDETLNSTGEQVPAPHAWRPDGYYEEMEEQVLGRGDRVSALNRRFRFQGRKKRNNHLLVGGVSDSQRLPVTATAQGLGILREVQGLRPLLSDDDSLLTSRGLHVSRLRLKTPSESVKRTNTSPSAAPPRVLGDAQRGVHPSPLAFDHEEDEQYHHNFLRGEGCPLDENGHTQRVPIHIHVPDNADAVAFMQYCVFAHVSVLSSLFVEGRTVHFTTGNSLLLDYVGFLFDEFIQDGWVTVGLCSESVRPYIPSWSITENVLIVLSPREGGTYSTCEIREKADMILQCTPCTVIFEPAGEENTERDWSMILMQEVKGRQAGGFSHRESAAWRVSWVPVRASTSFCVSSGEGKREKTENFQSSVNEMLRHVHAVTFVYTPYNCRFTSRDMDEWLWNGLPRSVHVVGVNGHPLDVLYFFPQAPFLHKKVGNAFRFRAVRRVIVRKNVHGGREGIARRCLYRCFCWSGLARAGLQSRMATKDQIRLLSIKGRVDDGDLAADALLCERAVDFLANPGKMTWLALVIARLFHI
uniref:Uncharacterized protein n=1 Tax=Trypanosoma congolense (strain IL3000) TaxID=1068625 RepID=G0UXS0_TRYCI|nr:conserved hypothetical protein [Trypanosoma congolense IL3000]